MDIPSSSTIRSELDSNIGLFENFLKSQQIRIISYDDYSWANGTIKNRIVKSPSWKMTGGFSIGKIGNRNISSGGSTRFSHHRNRHRWPPNNTRERMIGILIKHQMEGNVFTPERNENPSPTKALPKRIPAYRTWLVEHNAGKNQIIMYIK